MFYFNFLKGRKSDSSCVYEACRYRFTAITHNPLWGKSSCIRFWKSSIVQSSCFRQGRFNHRGYSITIIFSYVCQCSVRFTLFFFYFFYEALQWLDGPQETSQFTAQIRISGCLSLRFFKASQMYFCNLLHANKWVHAVVET